MEHEILTDDILMKLGFASDHPDYIIKKFKKHEKYPESLVTISCEAYPMSNRIAYNADMWKCDEHGTIAKRASLSDVKTLEELRGICGMCGIEL